MFHTDFASVSQESVTTKREQRYDSLNIHKFGQGPILTLSQEKLYSYVQAVNVKSAKGLQTALVEE